MSCSATQINTAAAAGKSYSDTYRMGLTLVQCHDIADLIAAAQYGGDEQIVLDYCASNNISGPNIDAYAGALGDAIAEPLASCRGR